MNIIVLGHLFMATGMLRVLKVHVHHLTRISLDHWPCCMYVPETLVQSSSKRNNQSGLERHCSPLKNLQHVKSWGITIMQAIL